MEKPPDWLLGIVILILALLLWLWVGWAFTRISAEIGNVPPPRALESIYVVESGNTLRASVPHYYFKPIVYATLLDCISFYESSHNPEARGAAGEIGQLQFMPSTFEQYCDGDINNPEDQFRCADEMITENWNRVYEWTTADMCI